MLTFYNQLQQIMLEPLIRLAFKAYDNRNLTPENKRTKIIAIVICRI